MSYFILNEIEGLVICYENRFFFVAFLKYINYTFKYFKSKLCLSFKVGNPVNVSVGSLEINIEIVDLLEKANFFCIFEKCFWPWLKLFVSIFQFRCKWIYLQWGSSSLTRRRLDTL
jgi:hypothetical protein